MSQIKEDFYKCMRKLSLKFDDTNIEDLYSKR